MIKILSEPSYGHLRKTPSHNAVYKVRGCEVDSIPNAWIEVY
jgi:hypothetical protein